MIQTPRFRSSSRPASKMVWVRRGVAVAAVLVVCGGMITAYVQREKTGPFFTDLIARTSGAEVAEILVTGVQYTTREELFEALQLKKGDALVSFNTNKAKERLEALPWVRSAAVARRLPNKVEVDVLEYTPIARVQQVDEENSAIWVVNKAGDFIITTDGFGHLPVLQGAGAADEAAGLFQLLQEYPNIMAHVQQAVRQGERRWDLIFKSGAIVQLPEDTAGAAEGYTPQQALAWLKELEDKRHVLTLAGGKVDLRLPDRVTLKIPPEAEAGAVLESGK